MSVMQEQKPVRSRRSFTDEFKRDAVALVMAVPAVVMLRSVTQAADTSTSQVSVRNDARV